MTLGGSGTCATRTSTTCSAFGRGPYTPLPVFVVDLDDASLSRIGQWPWPRDRLAEMVDRLAAMGVAVVVFDILFSEADRLSPRALVSNPAVRAAMGDGPMVGRGRPDGQRRRLFQGDRRVPVVLGLADAGAAGSANVSSKSGFAFVGQDPGAELLPLRSTTSIVPVISETALGFGVVNVNPLSESDTQREVPLVWRTPDGFMPSLAVEAIRVGLGESTILVIGPNSGVNRVEEIRVGGYAIPTTSHGLFPVHFRHEEPGTYIPAYQVLDPAMTDQLTPMLQGGIVFVGSSAAGLSDKRTTALGEGVPGVSIHAQIVEQVLLDHFLTRTDEIEGVEIIILVLVGF